MFAPHAQPGTPYWWDDAPVAPRLCQTIPSRCDMAVIGGGFTGLGAAITAARAGLHVVVLDSGHPGQGASTRNGGMFGAVPRLDYDTGAEVHGEEVAAAVTAEMAEGNLWTAEFIANEAIACDFQKTGRIDLAYTPAQAEAQKRAVHALANRTSERMQLIAKKDLGEHINTDCYFGGVLMPDHAAVHPRKYHDGLLSVALAEGVQVVPNCPVTDIASAKGSHDLATPHGSLTAGRLVVATNGYTTRTTPWISRRVFGLPSFIIATEELPEGMAENLAPGGRMMVETRKRHSYFRLSPDRKRILFGGRAYMTPASPERAARRLRDTMIEIWPDTAALKLTHAWSGFTGFTFSQTPHVGTLGHKQFALGYSGSGIAMAPYLGMKAALRALGDPRGETAFTRTRFASRSWYRGGRPHFLAAADLWYRHVTDRRESWAARR